MVAAPAAAFLYAQNNASSVAAHAARAFALAALDRTVHTDPLQRGAAASARRQDAATLRAAAKAYQARKHVRKPRLYLFRRL